MVSLTHETHLERDLNQAIDYYFTNHADEMQALQAKTSSSKFDVKKCVEMFQKFAKGDTMD